MDNTVENLLIFGKQFLKNRSCESYAIDTELIMMNVLDISRVKLFLSYKRVLSADEISHFKFLLYKRSNGMPIKYILGKCEFMGLEFLVNEYTLIPRNDTEILVEKAIELFKKNNIKNFIDIGTGTGCIPISILYYLNDLDIKCTCVDICKYCIDTAIKNSNINNVFGNIDFVVSDIFKNIDKNIKYDAIISNPPYIKTNDIKTLAKDVKDYEPINALDGGNDGLYFYRKIIEESKNYLNNKGYILFEIGYNQFEGVNDILLKNDFYNISITKDLAGLDRVVIATKKY